jgi:hypothetical protein
VKKLGIQRYFLVIQGMRLGHIRPVSQRFGCGLQAEHIERKRGGPGLKKFRQYQMEVAALASVDA